jgi:hypothetical protein
MFINRIMKKLINRKKEKGYIGMNFSLCLEAVTLSKIGPFRKILYRDFDGKCRILGSSLGMVYSY